MISFVGEFVVGCLCAFDVFFKATGALLCLCWGLGFGPSQKNPLSFLGGC